MAPVLSRIQFFPVKSMDAQSIESAEVLPSGALAHDRQFALVDPQGEIVNGKRAAAFHRLRTNFDVALRQLSLRSEGDSEGLTFDVDRQRQPLLEWLGRYLQIPVQLTENNVVGYPDDVDAPGPTLVSTATLVEVARWFPGLSVEDVRRRFRANLEIEGVEAFWEDRLVPAAADPIRFRLGELVLRGVNPCQRCAVPSRDASTGELTPHFAKTFAVRRQATLPPWAPRVRFDHFYRLAVNTHREGSQHVEIRVGDLLEVLADA